MSQDQPYDIYKAAGVIVRDRKLLLCREVDEDIFIAPGGRLDGSETSRQAAMRELQEELGIRVADTDLEEFGTFYATAATMAGKTLRMDAYLVRTDADIQPFGEIEEIAWVNTQTAPGMKIGSIFEHDVLPKLKALDLID